MNCDEFVNGQRTARIMGGGASSSAPAAAATAGGAAAGAGAGAIAPKRNRNSSSNVAGPAPDKRRSSIGALVGLPGAAAPAAAAPPPRRGSVQHVQEEAASFRSKSSSIKMMMRNQAYRKSFFKFLENSHKGKEILMDYFLLIETLKKNREKDVKRAQFMEAIETYEKKATGMPPDAPESLIHASTHHWKGVPNLNDEELGKHIERSQDDILLALTPLFETFLESPYFAEVKEAESKDEKRRFSTQSA